MVLYQLCTDFLKKCTDDHVSAFGAMSAFFMLLSFFPFMIFFLTLSKYFPYTKEDLINVLVGLLSFEKKAMITSVVNEVYRKSGTTIFTVSIITALWSSSRGMYSIIRGLNSVYDLDDDRNYVVLRLFSMVYTLIFAIMLVGMLILWVFGNMLYQIAIDKSELLDTLEDFIVNKRMFLSVFILMLLFMITYRFLPDRKSTFLRQWPGALFAAVGWIVCSIVCSKLMTGFTSFSYVYGSMGSIMILLFWLYLCMSLVFYGAEVNFFLENKERYHTLVWALRHNRRAHKRRRKQEQMAEKAREREKSEKSKTSGSKKPGESKKNSELKKTGGSKKPGESKKSSESKKTGGSKKPDESKKSSESKKASGS